MNTTSRQIALLSLCRYEREGKYSNLEADAAIKKFKLEGAEKKLYTKLLYGTIERKITLDYIISKLSDRPIEDMSLQMRNILRMSIYQMRFLDKIPDNAAVNEGVELAKKFEKPSSAAFANAILRRYAASGDKIKLPQKKDGIIEYLTVNYSVGAFVAASLVESLGEDGAEKMLKKINESEHYITLRVNTLVTSRDELMEKLGNIGVKSKKCKLSPWGINIESYIDIPTLFDTVGNGAFIEDEASQAAIAALAPSAGQLVVDVCAAPGGKTVSCAIAMENSGKIYAYDMHQSKIKLIDDAANRMGVDIVESSCRNAKTPNEELYGKADRVICDVPCSNLGVIGKKPEVRYKDLSDIDRLIATQREILTQSLKYLKKHGRLLYSTCTINKKENGDTVRELLEKNTDYSLIYERTLTPCDDGCDGFYVAVIEKND